MNVGMFSLYISFHLKVLSQSREAFRIYISFPDLMSAKRHIGIARALITTSLQGKGCTNKCFI